MRYFNNNFWRMITGFTLVIIMALGFLYLSQFYNDGSDKNNLNPEDFMAGSKSN